jgi:hypothetical protein
MTFIRSRTGKLVAGGVAAIVLAGGGAAVAATAFTSPSARDSAIISDAAGQLGIQPSALSSALTKAIDDQINAAVTAGQLSQSQASALESRLASGDLPLFGGLLGGAGAGGRFGGELSAAATYLGLTSSQIQSDLRGGQTLAQIANSTTGKSSSGLVTALVSAVESNLGSAVSAGKLTSSQEQTIESNLQQEVTNLVNGTGPAAGGHGRFGFGPGGMGAPGGMGFGGMGFGGAGGGELSAAATYLGLTSSQIQSDLRGGQTLAQIANSTTGKSSSGLVTALVSAEDSALDSAVSAGKLTSSQEQTIESNLQTRITDLVNGTRPQGFRGGFAPGFRGGRGPGSFGGGGGFGPGPSQTSTGSITN